MGPEGSNTHVSTRVMGTYGYAAPEYISTGRTNKSNLYLFSGMFITSITRKKNGIQLITASNWG